MGNVPRPGTQEETFNNATSSDGPRWPRWPRSGKFLACQLTSISSSPCTQVDMTFVRIQTEKSKENKEKETKETNSEEKQSKERISQVRIGTQTGLAHSHDKIVFTWKNCFRTATPLASLVVCALIH